MTKYNHKEIINNIITDLEQKGWEILKRWVSDDGWLVGRDTEYFVLMKDDRLVKTQYHYFNRGLMQKDNIGWSIFKE